MSPRQRLLSLLALLAVLTTGACSSGEDGTEAVLVFSAIPDQDATDLQQRYTPFAVWLSEQLEVEVRYLPTADYDATVEAFRNGDVHLAWFGGLSGVQARARVPGARAIAQGGIDPTFKSYFIAHRDTGVEPSEDFPLDLAGHTFAFGSPKSTSGRLMPEYFIRRNTGRSPAEFFGSEPRFSGAHDLTALWVADGTVDCGVLNFQVYDALVEKGEIDPEIVRVVWTTPPYPDYHWTAHPVLEERFGLGFIDRLQETLVGLDDPVLLALIGRKEGLILARNGDFEPIAEVARSLGFLEG